MAVPADQGARLRGEAPPGFLGDKRVEQEAALHVWDLVCEGGLLGGVALRVARSARLHDRTSAGLHHLAFRAADRADVDRAHVLMKAAGAVVLDAPADYPQYGAGDAAAFVSDPDGLKLEVVHFSG